MARSHADLLEEMSNLVKSKFMPPYLDPQMRKQVDYIILDTWKRIQTLKENTDG